MSDAPPIPLDVLIFGGGVAGLWLLDDLRRAGYRVLLLESHRLGAGQTVASQGIIHGGLKYTLSGMFTPSADAIRDMPQVWRDCLAARRDPDLSNTLVRAEHCHLWRTGDLRSIAGMIGARVGLRVAPTKLDRDAWPAALHDCPGDVFQLDEQVIDPVSLVADLAARNGGQIGSYDAESLVIESSRDGKQRSSPGFRVQVNCTEPPKRTARFNPQAIVLTAGRGNAELRRRFGLADGAQQVRPLHMVMLRGDLPALNGHCTDGARTRVTITTSRSADGQTVWQVGGQLAEDGVRLDRSALIDLARRELTATIPGVALNGAEWATYRVDRAEAAIGGKRPENVSARLEGPIITAWPTKLALAPRLSEEVRRALPPPTGAGNTEVLAAFADWPQPRVALPPWETEAAWITAI